MDTKNRMRRAGWAAAFVLVGAGMAVPAVAAGGQPGVGVREGNESGAATAAQLDEMDAAGVRGPARVALPVTTAPRDRVVLKGRTTLATEKVRIKRWKPAARTWVAVGKAESRNHAYKVTVTDKRAIAAPRLKVKTRTGAATVVVLTDACGTRPTKANGTLWACTFSDEFNGTTLDRTKWLPQTVGYTTGDSTNFACYKDDPQNVAVADGSLRLTLRQGAAAPCPGLKNKVTSFTSGSVSTYRLFSQRYGRFEARTRNTASSVSGLHEAFWLWPDDREVNTSLWPASGEIDVSETYSSYPTLAVPYLHYTALDKKLGSILTGKHTNTAWHCAAQRGVWNTWALEWGPSRIDIFVNGQLCMTNTSGDEAFRKKFIVAFTQGIGGAGNVWSTQTPMPATFEVDWLRVWQ